jgi:monovalent cation/hydrogen antiporter
VLLVVVLIRVAWVMLYNAAASWKFRRFGPGRWLRAGPPSPGAGLLVSWCGMRGIVTLAAAYALPLGFPYRDLILLSAFCVVVGTLVLQGLTLKPLILWLGLTDDNPIRREVQSANEHLAQLALQILEGDASPHAHLMRKEFSAVLAGDDTHKHAQHEHLRARIITEQRQALVQLRTAGTIGDQAFHEIEAHLDLAELSTAAQE